MTTLRKVGYIVRIAPIILLAPTVSACFLFGPDSEAKVSTPDPPSDVSISVTSSIPAGSGHCPEMTITFEAVPINLTGKDGKSGNQKVKKTYPSFPSNPGGEFDTCAYENQFLKLKVGKWKISVTHNLGGDSCTMPLLHGKKNEAQFSIGNGHSCTST